MFAFNNDWCFCAVEPTSVAINEVHYKVCVKSSYFNEPSMTCCTCNRLTVYSFWGGFFSTLGLIFGGVEESKIRNNQLFNMTILTAFFSVLLYSWIDCGVSLENISNVKWIIFWFFLLVVFIKIWWNGDFTKGGS